MQNTKIFRKGYKLFFYFVLYSIQSKKMSKQNENTLNSSILEKKCFKTCHNKM